MKYDPAKYLFLEIVQQANAGEFGGSPNVAELLICFEFELEQVGSVLQFLGLADEARDGWLPSFSLMNIIAERLTRQSKRRRKVDVTEDDREFLARLYWLAAEHEVDASDEDGDGTESDDGEPDDDEDDDEDDEDDDDDKDKEKDAASWCWNVLTALGLLKKGEGKRGGFKPTPRLKRLFESALEEHREELGGRSSKELSAQSSNILHLNRTPAPQVSDKSSTASVVPQPGEKPLKPSPPAEVAAANSIKGAAATPGSSVDILRARVVGKPVLGVTKPLSRRSPVPVPPFHSKRTGGMLATFRPAAAKQPVEKGIRLQNPVFRGQAAKVLRQPEPTKLSAKLPKLGKRKAQEKNAKRLSGDDLDCV